MADQASVSIDRITILPTFISDIERRLERMFRFALFAFLQAAAPRIVIRTGFAHGSLRNIAEALDVKMPEGRRGTTPRPKEYYYFPGQRRVLKTRFSGQRYSTSPSEIKLNLQQGRLLFEVEISYFRRRDSEQWRSLESGVAAATDYIERNFKNFIPDNIDDYVVVSRVR